MATRKRPDHPIHYAKSGTRSSTLRGRPSPHRGKSDQNRRRSSLTTGLKPRQKPDPTLRPWPRDVFVVAVHRHSDFDVRTIRGSIEFGTCEDCDEKLAFEAGKLERARFDPHCERRPLKIICRHCLATYNRKII